MGLLSHNKQMAMMKVSLLFQEHADAALHLVARQHSLELGKLLAEHSADVNIQNVRDIF